MGECGIRGLKKKKKKQSGGMKAEEDDQQIFMRNKWIENERMQEKQINE